MLRARIVGLEFVGDAAPATYTIDRTGLVGWFEGVDTREDRVARPVADGEFDSPGYLTGRLITLLGLVISPTSAFERALERLASIPARSLTRFSVETEDGVTWADVRRVGKPDISVRKRGLADYQVRLLAPDPRRFGPLSQFSGASVQVFHYGNAPAAPVVTVVGPVTGPYTVSSQGKSFTVTQSLAGGQSHRIDMATGWVTLETGAVQVGVVSSAQTFEIPPGQSVTVTGPASMAVAVPDTFI